MSRHGKGKFQEPKRPNAKLGLIWITASRRSWTAFVHSSRSAATDMPSINSFSGTAPSRDCRSTRLTSANPELTEASIMPSNHRRPARCIRPFAPDSLPLYIDFAHREGCRSNIVLVVCRGRPCVRN